MTTAADIAEIYIAAWNETDVAARRAMIADTWTGDAGYVDPLAAVEGHAGVDALIGEPDGHGDHVRFSWGLGPDGVADAPIKGTDYVRVEDGRLKTVTGFLDQVPG